MGAIKCPLCEKTINSMKLWNTHINGKHHLRRVTALGGGIVVNPVPAKLSPGKDSLTGTTKRGQTSKKKARGPRHRSAHRHSAAIPAPLPPHYLAAQTNAMTAQQTQDAVNMLAMAQALEYSLLPPTAVGYFGEP